MGMLIGTSGEQLPWGLLMDTPGGYTALEHFYYSSTNPSMAQILFPFLKLTVTMSTDSVINRQQTEEDTAGPSANNYKWGSPWGSDIYMHGYSRNCVKVQYTRQATYVWRNNVQPSLNCFCRGQAISITYCDCVLALVTQQANRFFPAQYFVVTCSVLGYTTLFQLRIS